MKIDFLISPAYAVPPISTSVPRRVQRRRSCRRACRRVRVGLDVGRVEDERLGAVRGELLVGRVDEQAAREERVPGAARDHAQRHAVRGVGAGEGVDDVELARLEVGAHSLAQPRRSCSSVERLVDVPHQTRSSVLGSRTTNLSLGERPV